MNYMSIYLRSSHYLFFFIGIFDLYHCHSIVSQKLRVYGLILRFLTYRIQNISSSKPGPNCANSIYIFSQV